MNKFKQDSGLDHSDVTSRGAIRAGGLCIGGRARGIPVQSDVGPGLEGSLYS